MNTHAHILIAAAVLCRSSQEAPNTKPIPSKNWLTNSAVVIGALIPDATLFLMFVQAKLRGIPDSEIWGTLYYSDFWQELGAISNSIPIFILIGIVGLLLGGRLYSGSIVGRAILVFAAAALLHCIADLPLHHNDGHAHFWPFTRWIFSSPVSYWDPAHYGLIWTPIEICIASFCAWLLWRQFKSAWIRFFLVLSILAYPLMMLFWFMTVA